MSFKNFQSIFIVFLLVITFAFSAESASILFFHSVASYSHRVATYPLADALAKRGHAVTYISPFHIKKYHYANPNITEIVPSNLADTIQSFITADFNINQRVQKLFPRLVFQFYELGLLACEDVFTSPEVTKHFEENPDVDLFIIDDTMAECAVALAHKYGAKHLFFNTVTFLANEYDQYGFAPESGAIPELEIDPPQTPMSFLEKVFNSLISIHFRYEHYKFIQALDEMSRRYLNVTDMPFLDDLVRNASLVFYVGDVVTDYPRTVPPMVVNVGGLLCGSMETKKLPQELEDFIGKGHNGFVYISLGSAVVASNLPVQIRKVFFDMMEAYPNLRFLWKWEGALPDKVPKNLFLDKWFPQNDLLGHPKIRAFITQAGRPSTTESLCHAVPMIAFPVLGDQDINANRMNKMGANVVLELGTVTQEELNEALRKVAYDKGMKQRMARLQKILLDKPMSAQDTAVWWTEYVLRHDNTAHLKGATFEQTWWERRLLDVWAFLYSMILLVIIGTVFIVMTVFKFVRHTSVRQLKNMKKDNIMKKKKK